MSTAAIYNRLGGAKIIKMPIKGEFDLVRLAESGIPKSSIKKLADSLLIEEKEMTNFLPVTSRNLQRYKDNDLLSEIVSDRLIGLASLFEFGEVVLGKNFFKDWLYLRNPALGGTKPVDLLKSNTGIELLKDVLLRMEHGVLA
jgi:putative toxin-antitoxin system antitoxin component (TIGR02293 family)